MVFNLMSALGGAGRAASENMAARQLQMDKIELIDTELETRNRLTRSEERRKENEQIEENTKLLKSLNFTDSQAAWIAKGGAKQVSMYADFAAKALAKNIDPNTLINSPMVNTDHQDPRNESALLSVNREAEDFMTESGPKRLATGVLGEVLGDDESIKTYPTLQAGYSAASTYLEKALNDFGEGSDEANEAQQSVNFWKGQIENAPQAVKSQTEWYSKSSRETIERNALIAARETYNIESDPITGTIKSQMEGRLAEAGMAFLDAANTLKIKAKPADGVEDSLLLSMAEEYGKKGIFQLVQHAQRVVSPSVDNVAEYGKKYSYLKTNRQDFGKQSFEQAMSEQGKKRYSVGDVIVVNRDGKTKILVYTGKVVEEDSGSMFFDAGEYFGENN